jgi:hypothetical protein
VAFRSVFLVCRKISGASAGTPLPGYAPTVASYEVFNLVSVRKLANVRRGFRMDTNLVKPINNDLPHKAHKAVSDRII